VTGGARRPAAQSSFDPANWPPDAPRLVAAALEVCFAAALYLVGGFWRLGVPIVVADTCLMLLPWRYPRSERSTFSIWAEAVLYLACPTALFAVAIAGSQPWLSLVPAPQWWPVGFAVGVALVRLSGLPLRAVISGALASLAFPTTVRHKLARCVSIAGAPPGEETLYRAPLLAVHGATMLPLGVLAAVGFVARHHLPPGQHGRTTRRVLATQCVAACALGALTWASRSIYPALLAHALNNTPGLLLEARRPILGEQPGDPEPAMAENSTGASTAASTAETQRGDA